MDCEVGRGETKKEEDNQIEKLYKKKKRMWGKMSVFPLSLSVESETLALSINELVRQCQKHNPRSCL